MARWIAAAILAAGLAAAAARLHAAPGQGAVASFSLLSGAAFGFVLQRSRFCFASAFRDLFLLRDRRGLLGVLAALAAGSVGYAIVFGAQLPDPSRYLPPTAHVAPLGWHLVLGGFAFGVGMVLAGGCISGNLYRLGEGSLVAPVALCGAVAGYWIGFLAWNSIYVASIAAGPLGWLPQSLGYGGALAVQLGALAVLAALLLRLTALPAAPGERVDLGRALRQVFVEGWPRWVGGIAVGAIGTAVFLRTKPLGVTAELGRVSRGLATELGLVHGELLGLDRLAGCRPIEAGVGLSPNGIFVIALVAGSLLAALLAGEFRLRLGRPRSFALAAGGGVLLGFGAMISLGCTVGTLLSGIMAFSLSGWVFGAGLLAGAWAGGRLLRVVA